MPFPETAHLSDEDLQYYETSYKLPLAVPPCPKNLSEYDYAKSVCIH